MDVNTPSRAKQEAVANACAHLNDVDLPNVYALAAALAQLVRSYRAVDPNAPVAHAELLLARIVPQLPAGV